MSPTARSSPGRDRQAGSAGSAAEAKAEAIALAEAHLSAIAFIEKHLFEPMTVKSLAEKSGFSPSRFSRGYQADGSFDFLAAVRIEPGSRPPKPLEVLTLPSRTYLVCRHILRAGDLYPQMTAAADTIWSERLPQSGRILLDASDFQLYPADFKVKDGWIEPFRIFETMWKR